MPGLFGLLIENPLFFLILAGSLVFSLTIHEFAHAAAAVALGDPTPRHQGRLTLNPLAHLDPLGTLAILLVGFGWGKPVLFDPTNLKNVRQGILLVAAAGPLSNILAAAVIIFLLPLLPLPDILWQFVAGVNLALAVFNLVPVHPLDGGKILSSLLPPQLAFEYEDIMQRYGIFILLALILPVFQGQSVVASIIGPARTALESGLYALAGLFW